MTSGEEVNVLDDENERRVLFFVAEVEAGGDARAWKERLSKECGDVSRQSKVRNGSVLADVDGKSSERG